LQAIVKGLTASELSELERNENVIKRGLTTFAVVGNALLAIRDARLYREQYKTFGEYCREKWGFERRQAYRLMDAATVVENVSRGTHCPPLQSERQARPLARLAPADQPEAWKAANDKAETEGRKVTAADVEKEVEKRTAPEPKSKGVGLKYASEAINAMMKIPPKDGLRADAWRMVRTWLSDNE
jgi:hypothetical protein